MKLPISEKFVDWLIERAKRTPYFHLDGYMNRYWLLPYGRQVIAARIHQILRSDIDRFYHDHPWSYVSVILRGGYWEVTPMFNSSGIYIGDVRKWYGAGSVIFRPAKTWHRLEVREGETVWTLFITGKYRQKWGYLKEPRHKIVHEELEYQFNKDQGGF